MDSVQKLKSLKNTCVKKGSWERRVQKRPSGEMTQDQKDPARDFWRPKAKRLRRPVSEPCQCPGFFIEIVPFLHQCPGSLLEPTARRMAEHACCGSTVFSTGPEAATETISSSDGGLRRDGANATAASPLAWHAKAWRCGHRKMLRHGHRRFAASLLH